MKFVIGIGQSSESKYAGLFYRCVAHPIRNNNSDVSPFYRFWEWISARRNGGTLTWVHFDRTKARHWHLPIRTWEEDEKSAVILSTFYLRAILIAGVANSTGIPNVFYWQWTVV